MIPTPYLGMMRKAGIQSAETNDYIISATTCADRTVSTIVDLTDEEASGVRKAAWALGLAHSQECDPTLEVRRRADA